MVPPARHDDPAVIDDLSPEDFDRVAGMSDPRLGEDGVGLDEDGCVIGLSFYEHPRDQNLSGLTHDVGFQLLGVCSYHQLVDGQLDSSGAEA